ncbi:MAG: hypothetical protein WDW38_008283 [Sanguina aurantia]
MLTYAMTLGNYITKLASTMKSLLRGRHRPKLREREVDGSVQAVQVWPTSWKESLNLVLPHVKAEMYLQPGEDLHFDLSVLANKDSQGAVCAMLGAGNHGFLAVKDVLVAMFEKNQVVVLKPHPMQAKWQALADHALAPLARLGYYASVDCPSLADTKHLLYNPLVDAMHMTGGIATHDAVVWGPTKEEQQRRKAAKDPLLKVPITSELGCVSPAIVVGGKWTSAQLQSQANNIAMGFTNNNSCNCNAIKVLVLPREWPQAEVFLKRLKEVLSQCPLVPALYPGIQARYKAWHDAYPHAEVISAVASPSWRDTGTALPYLVHTFEKVPDKPLQEYAFQVEAFCPVLCIVKLPTIGTKAFLKAAPAFANNSLWGTLSATFVICPQEEKLYPMAVQQALQDLKYGMVGVNTWTSTHFMLGVTSWGSYQDPSHPARAQSAGSGVGIVGNPHLVKSVQKVVYRVPIVGAAVPQPLHMMPVSRLSVLLIAGYTLDGWRGVWRALFRMRKKVKK